MVEANFNVSDYLRMLEEARQEIQREQEIMTEKEQRVELLEQCLDALQEQNDRRSTLQEENQKLKEECEKLRQQIEEERRQRADMEMKLNEMSKLSTGMAKKASEEAMLKALRTYANTSKRKTVDKRAFAKTAILEMANANGLDLPEDLKTTIEALDDEQPEPKVVVNGDMVQSKHVENEVNNVATGGTGIKVK